MIDGTTLCPHCNTRFNIASSQLDAREGMVRCGHCLEIFDARPGFIPDHPSPQLELPIVEDSASTPQATEELPSVDDMPPAEEQHRPEPPAHPATVLHPITLAEQIAFVQGGDTSIAKRRAWPWMIAALPLLLLLLAQAAYFFRVDLSVYAPKLKPVLVDFCQLLKCSVPLPQDTDLISIESSDLEADPAHENQITMSALLRNRAAYAQAFPNLELTLNDIEDKPLARRIFRPSDYLPPQESIQTGLLPNHELGIKLRLNTTDLKPYGYRLAFFYSKD